MGIINTARSYQSTITSDEKIIKKVRYDLIDESLKDFIENMKAINVEKEELVQIINDRY